DGAARDRGASGRSGTDFPGTRTRRGSAPRRLRRYPDELGAAISLRTSPPLPQPLHALPPDREKDVGIVELEEVVERRDVDLLADACDRFAVYALRVLADK